MAAGCPAVIGAIGQPGKVDCVSSSHAGCAIYAENSRRSGDENLSFSRNFLSNK
jgi:hypothetical protein